MEDQGHLELRSRLTPPYLRRAKDVEELIPWLYVRGVSTNDMESVLSSLLGANAIGLPPTSIVRCKKVWEQEFKAGRSSLSSAGATCTSGATASTST